jgi:WD40 repeat protein
VGVAVGVVGSGRALRIPPYPPVSPFASFTSAAFLTSFLCSSLSPVSVPPPSAPLRSHDGKMVATGGTMGIMRLFRLQLSPVVALHRSAELRGHSKSITSLAFSLDDKQIVSVGEDGGIFVWSVYA